MSLWSSSIRQQRSGEDVVSIKKKGLLYYFAVYDGHGRSFKLDDEHVAIYCDKYLSDRIFQEIESNFEPDFIKVFNEFNDEMMLKNLKGGCCATVLILDYNNKLMYSLNLGDSKTLIIKDGKIIFETIDHRPNLPEEKFRIENYGGRVKNNRVNGRLAVSRSFGDFEYGALVSSTPDIKVLPFQNIDILMSSDGIFENCNIENILFSFLVAKKTEEDKDISRILIEKLYPTTTDDCSIIHIHLIMDE